MPCKVLSFDEIHTTKDFFKDCNECVNLNYRKQLEQVEENALYQQLKVDQMYWKKRAMEEGTEELVDMYNRFNKLLAIKKEEERVNAGIKKPQLALLAKVPFNYEVDIGPMRRSELSINSNSSTPRSLSESVQNRIIDRMNTRPGLPISQDILANSRAGLRPTVTRPASEAPPSNTSQRVQLINELNASLASRASRGSRSNNSVRQLTPLEMSELAPPGGLSPSQLSVSDGRTPRRRAQQNRRFAERVVANLPISPIANIEQPTSGSGLRSFSERARAESRKKAKKKVTKSKQKSNYLM